MPECGEPKCRMPASKDWKGRMVCEDCFQRYQEEWDKIKYDLGS